MLFIVYVINAERLLGAPHASSTTNVVFPDPAEATTMRLSDGISDILRHRDYFAALEYLERTLCLVIKHIVQ